MDVERDQDTSEVLALLRETLGASRLSQAAFARALGHLAGTVVDVHERTDAPFGVLRYPPVGWDVRLGLRPTAV